MRWKSGLFLWLSLALFYALYALALRGDRQPRVHMALADPGHNGAIWLEMWCDQLTVGHDDSAVYCWHDGIAVIKVPHGTNFAWVPLEAK